MHLTWRGLYGQILLCSKAWKFSSPELDLLDPLANDGIMSAADSRYDLTMDALEPEITDVPGFFVTVELYAGR